MLKPNSAYEYESNYSKRSNIAFCARLFVNLCLNLVNKLKEHSDSAPRPNDLGLCTSGWAYGCPCHIDYRVKFVNSMSSHVVGVRIHTLKFVGDNIGPTCQPNKIFFVSATCQPTRIIAGDIVGDKMVNCDSELRVTSTCGSSD